MYRTSSAYKAEMQEYRRLESFVWVYLGLIDRDAQAKARVSSELTAYSQSDVFDNSRFSGYYATCEENFAKDNTYFMPENPRYYSVFNQGAVSKNILGSITFTFSETIAKIGGLTIDFGNEYPTEFTATNGHDTHTFEVDKGGIYVANGVFEDSDYITITPVTMVGGEQRLRIHSILFGLGFQFDNKDLISTKRTNEIDSLSLELPKKTFEFTINNLNQDWTMDNPNSYAKALEEQQIVQVTYGRKLPTGEIYKIPSGYMSLESWSSDHSTASFKAVGFLDYSTTTYYQGKADHTSLYDLAVDVFEDMGVEDYKIDTFLRTLYTDNPLPIDQHKACLQLIANAGLCTIFEDGNGVITLKANIQAPRYTLSAQNYESYSDIDRLMDKSKVYNFATCEQDYATDETDFFGTNETALVSYMYPTQNEMSITLEFEALWTFVGLTFQFGIIAPTTVIIAEYNDGSISEVHEYDVDDLNFYIDHEFYEVDKLVITFNNPDNTRIHLNKMFIGNNTDYTIRELDMQTLPVAEQTERIKSVNVKYYDFIEGDKAVSTQVNAEAGDNLVTFENPCYDYSIAGCTIVDSGAYFVIFTSNSEQTVTIEAKEYDKAEKVYTNTLRQTGQEVTLENDLISSAELAERVCDWLTEYYSGDVDYTITYRGEPALESGDRIYLESRFVDENRILVTSEELTTGIGMSISNTVKARQISYT